MVKHLALDDVTHFDTSATPRKKDNHTEEWLGTRALLNAVMNSQN
jgi:hypothetical protein